MSQSDARAVAEFRANGGVLAGFGVAVVLLHPGAGSERRAVPVAAVLEGGAWLVTGAAGVEDAAWPDDLREQPDCAVETAAGSLDVLAIELEEDGLRDAAARFGGVAPAGAPVFRLEPRG